VSQRQEPERLNFERSLSGKNVLAAANLLLLR
jgi:hypothetical protein